MNRGQILYHLVRADFLERTRRYSFLVTLAGAVFLAYAQVAGKMQLVVGRGYRGVYNSAWIGALMTVSTSFFISLFGFYVVKNSLQRDEQTRVGAILATTPMRGSFYTVAKTISNFAVLAAMVGVLAVAAVGMQLWKAEGTHLEVWKLLAPFLLVALPAVAMTAAFAVLFETISFLRGGFGNVVYFFLWTAILSVGIAIHGDDFTGMQLFYRSMHDTLAKIDASNTESFNFSIGGMKATKTFLWNGVDWTAPIVLPRLAWVAVAFSLALLASVFFHRFDPAREWGARFRRVITTPAPVQNGTVSELPVSKHVHLTPLAAVPPRLRFVHLVVAELRLLLQGQRWWWYAGAASLLIGEFASSLDDARGGFLVAAWIWSILIWSKMGCREAFFKTDGVLFSCPRSLSRQLPALWVAGVSLAAITGSGVGIRLLISGDKSGLAVWLAGALFIPTLALALGAWSGSSKFFEALYTVWWYVGPLHHTPGVDFMGASGQSSAAGTYFAGTALLLVAAYVARRRQLGYA
jgi:hypothetical protein